MKCYDLEFSFAVVNKSLDVPKSDIELRIEFHYLLLDWTKYIKENSF